MQLVYIKLIFSAIFWGSSAIAGKILLGKFLPSQVTFLRFFIAFIILAIFVLINKKHLVKVSIAEHVKLAVLGFVGVALCYYFYFEGLYYSTAFNAGLIEATIPLITLAISVLIKEESFDLESTFGFVVAYIGVIAIITRMDLSVIISSNYNLGDILLLLGTVCFGVYNVLLKKFSFSFKSQYMRLLLIFMYGSIALLFWLLLDMQSQKILDWSFSGADVFAIALLSLGASVLAYVFFNDGIKMIGASNASSFINLVPVITAILSLTILGERLSYSQIVGSVIILSGVYISQNGIPFLFKKKNT